MKKIRTLERMVLLFGAVAVVVIVTLAGIDMHQHVQYRRQYRTMGDMRTLATAMESYSIDARVYPITPKDRLVEAEWLAKLLEPTYVKAMPRVDAWGRALLVESAATEYTIISRGSDGSADGPNVPRPSANGGTSDIRSDLIFSTGSFVQFPESRGD